MARRTVADADAVFVVGTPSMKGVHALVRVIHDVVGAGVAATRVVPVVNQAPRSRRARAGLASTVHALVAPSAGPLGLAAPVFLPTRPVEDALRDGVRLPAGLGEPLAGALLAVTGSAAVTPRTSVPERVRPGSLGSWTEQAADG